MIMTPLNTVTDRSPGRVMSPRLLLAITLVGLIVVGVLVILEYQSRQKDLLQLLGNQSKLFIRTLSSSAQNAFSAAQEFENEMNFRIISTLGVLERLDRQSPLTKNEALEMLQIADVDEIHLYDADGTPVIRVSSLKNVSKPIPRSILQPRIKKSSEKHIFAVDDFPQSGEERIVYLVPQHRGGAIVALMTRARIETIRRILGFGYFLKRFQASENVEYVVLQNTETIVAGSFGDYALSSFSTDTFLGQTLAEDTIRTRILEYDGQPVYEAVSRFSLFGEPIGVLRLGLSMKEYQQLAEDAQHRLYVFAAVLFVFGLVFVNFILSYRLRLLLRRDLARLQENTNTILNNLQSGVISIDHEGTIQTANKQALSLLGKYLDSLYHQPYAVLPAAFHSAIRNCLGADHSQHKDDRKLIQWRDRDISLRMNALKDGENRNTCILLLEDVTDEVRFEEQLRRNEKLTAMQNLASAVAHEIRNPLNSIRLNIDFVKKKTKSHEATKSLDHKLVSVQNEITRISTIVEQYLSFGRLPELTLESVLFPELVRETTSLFEVALKEKNISIAADIQTHPPILGDRNQIKQVFVNLIRNAQEAIPSEGSIRITGIVSEPFYEIRISDTGKGIAEKDRGHLFDLGFTTKKGGTGIGLTIVKQIITTHQGTLKVESEAGKGTTVFMQFPLKRDVGRKAT